MHLSKKLISGQAEAGGGCRFTPLLLVNRFGESVEREKKNGGESKKRERLYLVSLRVYSIFEQLKHIHTFFLMRVVGGDGSGVN